ncbi:MAG TPA: hypothetical protein VGQ10_16135 [Vicinamibacterales bacterium]|jgi:hypothetical protein|nr:hypothetical protein [Vicinamibacterales bacterium]
MASHIAELGGKLEFMTEERRNTEHNDRRAHSRGGRRPYDQKKKPWYLRRRLWLATVSILFVGWRKLRGLVRRSSVNTGSPGNGVTV